MTKDWTPEPWVASDEDDINSKGSGFSIATVSMFKTKAMMQANRRRIVAAVNACADIDTEVLESLAKERDLARRIALLITGIRRESKWGDFCSFCGSMQIPHLPLKDGTPCPADAARTFLEARRA